MSWIDRLFHFIKQLLDRIRDLLGRADCPSEPTPEGCPISWQPSVVAPVFYGVRDYEPSNGAPGYCRVFFPSLDGSVFDAPILESCSGFPLVIFCHGHCSSDPAQYTRWFEFCVALARSGYIVLAPSLPNVANARYPFTEENDLDLIAAFDAWIRSAWEHSGLVLPYPRTAVVGHSYGALVGSLYAASADVAAYVALSAGWGSAGRPTLDGLTIPKLLFWGDFAGDKDAFLEDADWSQVQRPKHGAYFLDGDHWSYLPPGRTNCGSSSGCNKLWLLAGDITAAFLGRYLPPDGWPSLSDCVPATLVPPKFKLTTEQQFYAGGHLVGFDLVKGNDSCKVKLSWDTGTSSGSVTRP